MDSWASCPFVFLGQKLYSGTRSPAKSWSAIIQEMKIKIRKAVAADASMVADILTEATHYKLQQGDTSWGSDAYSAAEVRAVLDDTYLVCVGEEPVGTVVLQWEDKLYWGDQPPHAGYIHKLAVKQHVHGLRIGEQTIAWALLQVKERGRGLLRLDCRAINTGLGGYYERQGFRRVGTVRVRGADTALYEKKVTNA